MTRPALSESDLERMRAAVDSAHAQADAPPAELPAPQPRQAPDESKGTEPPPPSTARPELPAALLPTPRQAPPEPPPAVPAPRPGLASRPRPAWLREHPSRGRAIIVGSAILTLVAILAGWSASLLTRHAGPARIRASAANGADVRDAAAAWVASQVSRAGLVSCDPVMCQALEAAGVPATGLLVLRRGASDPLDSDVIVVTPAVTRMIGGRLLTADAPAAVASFGSGARRISVRWIYPKGAAAFFTALRKEIAGRKAAGASLLLQAPRVTAAAAARRELLGGQVDSRLLLTLGEVASQWPVSIAAFGDRGPGATPGISLRSAELTVTGGRAGPNLDGLVQKMAGFVHGLGVYFADARIRTVRLADGQEVVRIAFTVPGRFGLLPTSAP